VNSSNPLQRYLGAIPNRLQLAGGWIDQPFVSRHNPEPPGSMVVVQIEPNFRPMERSGLAGGTRAVAMKLWRGRLPRGSREKLVRALYRAENNGKAQPSGSQDMIGLIYSGINRLDYDFCFEAGVFPRHIESLNSSTPARWLEKVLHLLPVEPRPEGYSPLGTKNLQPKWVAQLGYAGRDCFDAIRRRDAAALGQSLNLNMRCWEMLLPQTVRHPLIKVDLPGLLRAYQKRYPGAMYSGCGGGYLIVVAEEPVPGSLSVTVRTSSA